MNLYNVHIYREMRLTFEGIEAETPAAAAEIARDKPTGDADDINECDGESLAATVDLIGDEDYSQCVTIDFEGERQRKAAAKLLAVLRMASNYMADDLDEADETEMRVFNAIRSIIAEAEAACIPSATASVEPIKNPYSVLLLYPDYANDGGTETYYAFAEAADPIDAVAVARRQAAAAQEGIDIEPDDFSPLLVTQGHHAGEPLFNK